MGPYHVPTLLVGAYTVALVGVQALDPDYRTAPVLLRAVLVTTVSFAAVVAAWWMVRSRLSERAYLAAALQGVIVGGWVAAWEWGAYGAAHRPTAGAVGIRLVAFALIWLAAEWLERRRGFRPPLGGGPAVPGARDA